MRQIAVAVGVMMLINTLFVVAGIHLNEFSYWCGFISAALIRIAWAVAE